MHAFPSEADFKLRQISENTNLFYYYYLTCIETFTRLKCFCNNDQEESIKSEIKMVNVSAVFSGGERVLPARGDQILPRKNRVSPPPLQPVRGVRHPDR